MTDEAAIPGLVHLIDDPDQELETAAVAALSRMPTISDANRAPVKDALQRATTSKNHFVRGHAYAGLLHVDPQGSLPMLKYALEKDPLARLDIFYSIIANHVSEAVPVLENFIREDELNEPNDPDSRAVAAQAVFKLTGKRIPYKGLDERMKLYKDPYSQP